MSERDARAEVTEALTAYLEDDEIVVRWCAVAEVAGADGSRYLVHRHGSGHDGSDDLMLWDALGMLRASLLDTEDQLRASTEVQDDE